MLYRWFTDPSERSIYPQDEHLRHTRTYVAGARTLLAREPDDPRAREIVEELLAISPEFAALWSEHEVTLRLNEYKRMVHPRVGPIELYCQQLSAVEEGQILLVYTATPGTEDHEKLKLLSVIGSQQFEA